MPTRMSKDLWLEIATHLPLRSILSNLGVVSSAFHEMCHNNPYLLDAVLFRDYRIPSSPDICSARALRVLHSSTLRALPFSYLDTTGGMWSEDYHPRLCLNGTGTYCTDEGKNTNVVLRARPVIARPLWVAYATHILVVAAAMDGELVGDQEADGESFTSPLHRYRIEFENGGQGVGGEALAASAPLLAVALPAPVRCDSGQVVSWHLLDSSGEQTNIDVGYLAVYGWWVPTVACPITEMEEWTTTDDDDVEFS